MIRTNRELVGEIEWRKREGQGKIDRELKMHVWTLKGRYRDKGN